MNTTTLSLGWKLTRSDATVMAFTDHDNDLTVGGVTYSAATALTASEAANSLGMAVNDQDVSGGLNSAAITESDLSAGVYDGARVELIEIDWTTQTEIANLGTFYLGQITRTASAFTAELRSRAGILAQRRGRVCQFLCDAELGDERCGVNLATVSQSGTVATPFTQSSFTVTGLSSNPDGYFSRGMLTWTSGANTGAKYQIRAGWGDTFHLWRTPVNTVATGDSFSVTPGCDKTFPTCRLTFLNGDNHRGFPTVAGQEGIIYAINGDPGLDGGSRNGVAQ